MMLPLLLLLTVTDSPQCPSFSVSGMKALDGLGQVVERAGDLDGDGREDILVTAPQNIRGRGYVRAYSGAGDRLLYEWLGQQANSSFGVAADGAGDVDGDGRDDVVVGAPGFGAVQGRVSVFSGRSGMLLAVMTGTVPDTALGYQVTGMSDLDGDQLADVAIARRGLAYRGEIQFVSPARNAIIATFLAPSNSSTFAESMDAVGDVNLDGIPDLAICDSQFNGPHGIGEGAVFVVSGATGTLLYAVYGGAPSAYFGRTVTAIGDWTGDGIPDWAASHLGTNGNQEFVTIHDGRQGQRWLVLAQPYSGFGTALDGEVDWNDDGVPDLAVGSANGLQGAVQVLDAVTHHVIYEVLGLNAPDRFGAAVEMIPDLNGDRRAELVVGAPMDSRMRSGVGAVHFMVSCDVLRIFPPSPGRAGVVNGFMIEKAMPSAEVAWTASRRLGSTPLLPCRGLRLELDQPILVGTAPADSYGRARLRLLVPAGLAGQTFAIQAWQPESCRVSEVLVHRF